MNRPVDRSLSVGRGPLEFRRIPWDKVDWDELDRFPDRTLFQSRGWLEFVVRTQHAQPHVAAMTRGDETLGFFTCLVVKRSGLRIAGSPFKGWTTSYMGFNVLDDAVRDEALLGIGRFLFGELGCVHFELMDREVGPERARALGLEYAPFRTFEIDLTVSEDELLGRMHTSARRYARRAEKNRNIIVEEARDPAFADDYYAQLREVFGKQGLTPTYGIDRVRMLIESLRSTGDLLLLRARDRSGRCLATGIFPARHGTMYFWGGASWGDGLSEHPNEPLHWHAMRYWKRHGMIRYDMGGGGKYKENYGGVPKDLAWIRQSRNRLISGLRDAAYRAFNLSQRVRGWRPFATS